MTDSHKEAGELLALENELRKYFDVGWKFWRDLIVSDQSMLIADIVRLAATRPQAAPPVAWRPIETAPKDGTIIDVWFKLSPDHSARWANVSWNAEHSVWISGPPSQYEGGWEATHWMPRPGAPGFAAPPASPSPSPSREYVIRGEKITLSTEVDADLAAQLNSPSPERTCSTCHAVLADGPQPAATYEARSPVAEREALKSVENEIAHKIDQLDEYVANHCQGDSPEKVHARTVAEGRKLQANMDLILVSRALSREATEPAAAGDGSQG